MMSGMSKKAIAAALSTMIGLSSAAALPMTVMADDNGYKTKELKVAIWDNNQLNGLQQIADEWSKKSGVKVQIDVITWMNTGHCWSRVHQEEHFRMYSGCISTKRRNTWMQTCS